MADLRRAAMQKRSMRSSKLSAEAENARDAAAASERGGSGSGSGGVGSGSGGGSGSGAGKKATMGRSRGESRVRRATPTQVVNVYEEETDHVLRQLILDTIEKRQRHADTTNKEEQKRAEIQRAFDAYEERIKVLEQSLKTSQGTTDKMLETLDAFDAKLTELEARVEPIRESTRPLQLGFDNIDNAGKEVKKVLDMFATADQCEAVIARGKVDAEFFDALERINAAIDFLSLNRTFKSSEKHLTKLKTLKQQCLGRLETSFEAILKKASSPQDPTRWQPLPERLELVEPSVIDELKQRIDHLASYEDSKFLNVLCENRSKFIVDSVKKLNPDKIVEASEKTSRYIKGSHAFLFYFKVMLKLIAHEKELVTELLPDLVESGLYLIVQEGADKMVETAEAILKVTRTNDRIFGVFILFDIWENVQAQQSTVQQLLDIKIPTLMDELTDWSDRLRSVCQRSFSEVEEDLRDLFKEIPSDGTVHEASVHGANYLKRLFEYKATVESLLSINMNKPGPAALSEFVQQIIATVQQALERTAKKEKTLMSNVFLLNNFHYIASSIRGSPELGNMGCSATLGGFDALINLHRDNYKNSWNKVRAHLVEGVTAWQDPKFKKEAVKKCWKGFVADMDAAYATQRYYAVPDPELKAQLKAAIESAIVPEYSKFYNLSERSTWAAEPKKHMKWTPLELQELIERFFEDSQVVQKESKPLANRVFKPRVRK